MNNLQFAKARVYITGAVALAIWALLAWNYFHGGVPAHHILADKNLPLISNWWGALLLPLLTWFLLGRIQKGIDNNAADEALRIFYRHKIYGFAAALFFGILLSFFFTAGYPDLCGYMILLLLPAALFFPVYKAEYLLGFVLGMTFTFGAVLPTGVGIILCLLALVLHLFVRTGVVYLWSKLALLLMTKKRKTNS